MISFLDFLFQKIIPDTCHIINKNISEFFTTIEDPLELKNMNILFYFYHLINKYILICHLSSTPTRNFYFIMKFSHAKQIETQQQILQITAKSFIIGCSEQHWKFNEITKHFGLVFVSHPINCWKAFCRYSDRRVEKFKI